MNLKMWVASGALLAAMPGAYAQQPSRTPDPADPAAPVPVIVYQSALAGYVPAPKDLPSPDKSWRAANDTVGAQPGHGAHHAPAPAPAPRKDAATPKAGPAPAPQPHHQHH